MAQVAALLLLVFGLLPIANWIPGGRSAVRYPDLLQGWLSGGAIVLGIGIVATIVVRRRPDLWRAGLWARIAETWRNGGRRYDALIAVAGFGLYALVSRTVLSAKPLTIDEIIEVFQARIFATGHLWLPAPAHTEFSSATHLIDWGGKVYGQFPAGGPAMLMLGTLLHAEWLVDPIAAMIAVFLFARLVRLLNLRAGTALAALLVFAFSPFVAFLAGSMMNHVTEVMWLMVAALGLAHATRDLDAHPRAALGLGLGFGLAAAIRPVDAAAFAIPAAIWLAWRVRLGRPHFSALAISGVGVAVPLIGLFAVNAAQTGDPFRFGYIEMWGKAHELGFHASPWGAVHTPARGLELVNLYLLQLQEYFLEAPVPSLIFATGALALSVRLRAFDRWVLAGSGLLLLAYFAYWHDGFYLGPRFMLPLAPWIALWTARLPGTMEERQIRPEYVRGVAVATVTAILLGFATSIPNRAHQYHFGMLSMRFDVDADASASGVHDALVLVRESWGAQLLARMWALGVNRPDADHIYLSNDACRLEGAISDAEHASGDAADLKRRLIPFQHDSARLVVIHSLPDTSVRFIGGSSLRPVCVRRLREDGGGFTLYPPLLLARGHGNVFLRDLHARDTLLLKQFPDRPIWMLRQGVEVGGPLHFERVSLDSMRAEWEQDRAEHP